MAYIYICNNKKGSLDFNTLLNYVSLEIEPLDWDIAEVYADGWVEVPNGFDDMLSDISKSKGSPRSVALFSLEGLDKSKLEALSKTGVLIYCVTCPWILPSKNAKDLIAVLSAEDYYKKLKSFNIRAGIKNTDKHSGAPPFGYSYSDEGKLIENEHYPVRVEVIRLRVAGVAVSDIATRLSLTVTQVYGIIKRGVVNG